MGSPDRRFHLLCLALVALAFVAYVAFQLPMPTHRGPDSAYYLLGCRHIGEGRWPWGNEPPLAFALLYPFTLVLPERVAFIICSALAGALTLYFLGRAAAFAARVLSAHGHAQSAPAPAEAAAWAVALGAGYMFLCFVSGLLKNAWANVFLLAAMEALLGGRRGATALLTALAALCHPGITATWLAALVLAGAFGLLPRLPGMVRGAARAGSPRPGRTGGDRPPRWHLAGPRLCLIAAGTTLALAALAYTVVPTAVRYLGTYLGSQPAGATTATLFSWDFASLAIRYLPLWPLAWLGVRLVAVRQRALPGKDPACGLAPVQETLPALGLLSFVAWVAVLGALASVTDLTSRRFEVQMFIPLCLMGAMAASGWKPAHRPGDSSPTARRATGQGRPGERRFRPGVHWLAAAAVVFGLLVQVLTLRATQPPLSREQVSSLEELGQELPEGSRLVVVSSGIRYWAELLAGAPALSPGLHEQRVMARGPVFLLVQDPPAGGEPWPEEVWGDLRSRELVVWEENGLFLLRGRDDPEALASWRRSDSVQEMMALLDGDAPPGVPAQGGYAAVALDQLAGWVAFPLLGMARACGLPAPAALALALPASVLVLLWLVECCARRWRPITAGRTELSRGATA